MSRNSIGPGLGCCSTPWSQPGLKCSGGYLIPERPDLNPLHRRRILVCFHSSLFLGWSICLLVGLEQSLGDAVGFGRFESLAFQQALGACRLPPGEG